MTTRPKVSIIVVSFRDRDNVLACLRSISHHAELPHEVVVVDDASADGTPDVVREQFPGALLVERRTNGGLVAGRNEGLRHARGRYVLMLDSDTQLRPHAVARMARVLDARPRTGLVGPRLLGADGALQLSCRRFPPFTIPLVRRGPFARISPNPPVHRRHMMQDFDHASERPVVWVSGAAQMWRREFVERLGPFDRRLSSYGGEDLDWCLRVWESGFEVRYIPDAEVIHHGQQVTRRRLYGRESFRALRDWYYLQWKHRRLRTDGRLREANA